MDLKTGSIRKPRHGAAAQRPVGDLDSSLLLSPVLDPSSLSLLPIPSLFPHQHAWQTTELRLCLIAFVSDAAEFASGQLKGIQLWGPTFWGRPEDCAFRLLYTPQICHKFLVVSTCLDYQDLSLTLGVACVPCWSMHVISCEVSNVLGCRLEHSVAYPVW